MRPIDDSDFLTPDQRRGEVVSILASSVLQHCGREALPSDDSGENTCQILVNRGLAFPKKLCSVSTVVKSC
jgi:hypothetical protein